MKHILFMATGGTIASEQTGDGLMPRLDAQSLLSSVPQIRACCRVFAISPMQLDSTNMRPCDWLRLAACIEREYDNYDGFVIAHGTDTMAYTAGALSYLVQHSAKPIVITGAQKPISLQDTDARINLAQAFTYAVDRRAHGVVIVFDGKVIMGTRARKTRTKSRNAFDSVDYPAIALLTDRGIVRYLSEDVPSEALQCYCALDDKVAVIKLVPGMDASVLDYLRERNSALVIESFGVGGLPNAGGGALIEGILRWKAENKPVVITTQVPHEGSDMSLYEVGLRIKSQYDVMEAYNMTLEAVVTKLMWILGQTKQMNEVRELFYTPVAHDLLVAEAHT